MNSCKGFLLFVVPLLSSCLLLENSMAQVQENKDMSLIPIPEIVITAQRDKTSQIIRPESISKMDSSDPHLATTQSTPDALATVPGPGYFKSHRLFRAIRKCKDQAQNWDQALINRFYPVVTPGGGTSVP